MLMRGSPVKVHECQLGGTVVTPQSSRTRVQCKSSSSSIHSLASLPSFLGSTFQVPPIGLGLAALGRPGYINLGHDRFIRAKTVEDMRLQSWEVLDAAYDLGVRYFDAARSYGMAEDFLSSWLAKRGLEPSQCLVGSKWGYYYTADFKVDTGGQPHEIKDHSRSRLNDQSATSNQLLGSHLNLYQIHSATLESGVLQSKEVLEGLEQLSKEKGWRIGLSLSGPKQADTLRSALNVRRSDGQPLFSAVQATWNLLEQSAGDALLEAKQTGMEIIIKEGLANGRLAGINPDPGFAPKQSLLNDAAQSYNTTVDALALAVLVAQQFKPMVLSGACTVDQLRSNMQAVEVASRLRGHDVESLRSSLKQDAGSYWGERSALPWN